MRIRILILMAASAIATLPLSADTFLMFGDPDCLGQDCYGVDVSFLGATLTGLAPNAVTMATDSFSHGYPFSPSAGDYPGTDQIYVGSVQTGAHDGYSGSTQRINGPDAFDLDYSPLLSGGNTVTGVTLGIAADDFQFPGIGNPFTATINGTVDTALSNELNSLNQGGPIVQFFTIGIDPSLLNASNHLDLSIDEGGDGGDGYAVDFLTVGVTTATAATPEPASIGLFGGGMALGLIALRRRKTSAQ
jgi:hypothetical protein